MLGVAEQLPGTTGVADGLIFRCPRCRGALRLSTAALTCAECFSPLIQRDGIWLALPPEREEYYAQFMADYQRIRAAEGRGSRNASYYLALPHKDLSGHNQAQWTIRARTWSCLVRRILPGIQAHAGGGARILDIGAGNGWMSYQLALRGFRPVAVDLLINDHDGLGAARHFRNHLPRMFPCAQAESTRLPFASAQFDAVVFNASFHYAESYLATLLEALRCLRTGGTIVIADSPWYSRRESGEQMLAERRAAFRSRYGTSSTSIHSQEFLTDDCLERLERNLGLRWERHTPWYGLRWAMRPWIARWRRRREPSRFRIYTARKIA